MLDTTKFPQILAPGKRFKAEVSLVRHQGSISVLKSYAHTSWYLKPLAKVLMRREINMLKKLSFSPYVPEYKCSKGAYGFVMEYIDGSHPSISSILRDDQIYRDALAGLREIHRAGVVHNDLRGKNMIINPLRGLVFIDFAAAMSFPSKYAWLAKLCVWLQCRLQRADVYHLVKQKRALSDKNYSQDELMLVCKERPFKRLTVFWKRFVLGKEVKAETAQRSLCEQLISGNRL